MMTKRRDFLKKSLLGTAGMALAGGSSPAGLVLGNQPGIGAATTEQFFDAAPFALLTSGENGKAHTLRWGEPRKIRRVVAEFSDIRQVQEPGSIKIQYWHKSWNGKADPVLAERGAGSEGWTEIDDWTHGEWKEAGTRQEIEGNTLTFTFEATDKKEFDSIAPNGVGYRKTLKIRLLSDHPIPVPAYFRAYTDAVCSILSLKILMGRPAEKLIDFKGSDEGTLEIFNGSVEKVKPVNGSGLTVKDGLKWVLSDGREKDGLAVDVIMATDPVDQRYDRTILTLRSKYRPVSFCLDEIARGERVLIDDPGILVVRGDDDITIEGYRALRKEFPGRTIYDRVEEHGEQTLMGSWNDMPIKHPIGFVHGLPGNRNVMKQLPGGDIEISNSPRWFKLNRSDRDSARKGWKSPMLKLLFGLPDEDKSGGRELYNGYIPRIRSWWQDGPLFYEQVAMLTILDRDLDEVRLDDPALLIMQIRVVNISSDEKAEAALRFSSCDEKDENLVLHDDRMVSETGALSKFRYLLRSEYKEGFFKDAGAIGWKREIAPGESHKMYLFIPSVTIDKEEEINSLRNIDFDSTCRQMCRYWTELTARGSMIHTPEPWLNDFYKAHARHLMVNSLRDLDSDRLYPHVGTFSYGVYANESIMMVSDFDRRGYHSEAARCLQTWLDFQGTVALPGNFSDSEGLFYGAAGSEDGGYNKHHGYVMWGMAEHWWFTRDKEWMDSSSPGLIKACDWVIRQRKLTMKNNPDGTRPVEYGFLPTGGLEDVQDYWHWLATNSATVWGFTNLAAAMADYGHPEAGRLAGEAKAYRDDVLTGLNEARILSPVVRLRDGTYVPKYPSRLYERGRSYGWIRETLEGSIFLIAQDLISAGSLDARWIMKDYEDNLYISDTYGYNIPVFDRFWFSRGGFSMQSQLLDGPVPYIKNDQVKHYLRAYFNGFTAAFFPDVRMCNEHALPELGYPAGDYFKSSDEAQSTYWLRMIFVREDGNDLYLGQAIPRYWLSDGENAGIEKMATHFGPVTFKIKSEVSTGRIKAELYAPERNSPAAIYVRFRHPESKPIRSVTVNGRAHEKFDIGKEWIILPGSVTGLQEIIASY